MGSPNPRFPPYAVKPLHVHGAPAGGKYQAWRPRRRQVRGRRSLEVRPGGHLRATSATDTAISPKRSRILGRSERPGGQKAIRETQRSPTPTRAKRYAQRGFGDACARNHGNHRVVCTSRRDAKIAPRTERAKRYAQCGFADMKGLKRFMWQRVRCMFCNFAKTWPNGDGTKS